MLVVVAIAIGEVKTGTVDLDFDGVVVAVTVRTGGNVGEGVEVGGVVDDLGCALS